MPDDPIAAFAKSASERQSTRRVHWPRVLRPDANGNLKVVARFLVWLSVVLGNHPWKARDIFEELVAWRTDGLVRTAGPTMT